MMQAPVEANNKAAEGEGGEVTGPRSSGAVLFTGVEHHEINGPPRGT